MKRNDEITLRFLGSGDAFGSGGRLQPAILVNCFERVLALDFGLTGLIGLRGQGLDPNSIDTVVLSHLHGDHCGGVCFLLMDAMLGSKRQRPLTIAGPSGVQSHLENLQEALFPGSSVMKPKFDVNYIEIVPGESLFLDGIALDAIAAVHTEATKPLSLRLRVGNKVIVYTGDGEATDELSAFVRDADLLITECYYYEKPVRWHCNYPDVARLKAKKTILTHMSTEMLGHINEVPELCACDGLVVTV